MRRVKRLPVDTGISGWNAILPEQPAPTTLETHEKSDWLVIGAGFAGLSAARRLSQLQSNSRIVVLEANRIAGGPAGRNSGFMLDLPHDLASANYAGQIESDRKHIDLNRKAIDFAEDVAREYKLSDEVFIRSGKVNGAATDKGMQHNFEYAQHLETLGEPSRHLDADEMKKLTGSKWYLGGLFTPSTAVIHPAAYIRGLAGGLAHNGIDIFENSPVVSLENENGNWIATTPAGSVSAPKVILAVNGHAESFGFFKRRLVHVILFASMTRALSKGEIKTVGGERRWGITPADPIATTVRRISGTGGDRIVTRNRVIYQPSMQVSDSVVNKMGRTHDRSFVDRFPELQDVPQEYRWSGRLCLSLNNVPAFGEQAPGLFSACCQNGLGTAQGTLAGMAAAEFAVEGKTPLATALLKHPEPKKLPPEPLAWIGANAYMRWNEWKAGREV